MIKSNKGHRRLVNTEKALEKWKALDLEHMKKLKLEGDLTDAEVYKLEFERRLAGEAVGYAYWQDTRHINSKDTCIGCVRPGPWLDRQIALGRGEE